MTGTENSDKNRSGEPEDSQRGDPELGFWPLAQRRGNVGEAWDWNRGPNGGLSGELEQRPERGPERRTRTEARMGT